MIENEFNLSVNKKDVMSSCENKCCWAQIPYYNEKKLPTPVTPTAGSWPMYYFKRDDEGRFFTLEDKEVDLSVKDPSEIDFNKELVEVIEVQECLINQCDPKKVAMALYWGTGVPVQQWTPIALKLLAAYNALPTESARIMGVLQSALNDGFVICWYYKYLYCIPRPCQYDHDLKTVLNTPRFPTYISGHSVISAICENILGYYFPNDKDTLKRLAEDASISRLYGGIHFRSDLSQGLDLGRRIGKSIVEYIKSQGDCNYNQVDKIYTDCVYNYNILPPYASCK